VKEVSNCVEIVTGICFRLFTLTVLLHNVARITFSESGDWPLRSFEQIFSKI
jgi:hypothetical protein